MLYIAEMEDLSERDCVISCWTSAYAVLAACPLRFAFLGLFLAQNKTLLERTLSCSAACTSFAAILLVMILSIPSTFARASFGLAPSPCPSSSPWPCHAS